MGIFFSSFSEIRDYKLENIQYRPFIRYIDIKINTSLNRLLSLPIVWNIFCHLIPLYKLDVGYSSYRLVNNIDEYKSINIHITDTNLYIGGGGEIPGTINELTTFVETLQKSINIAIKYISEKRDLNSLALSSKDFIDIEPKPRRSPLRLWGKEEERTETAKDEALNIFAHHYYPKVIKNMGKEIGIPIELDIDKNREKPEIRKMNLLFREIGDKLK